MSTTIPSTPDVPEDLSAESYQRGWQDALHAAAAVIREQVAIRESRDSEQLLSDVLPPLPRVSARWTCALRALAVVEQVTVADIEAVADVLDLDVLELTAAVIARRTGESR